MLCDGLCACQGVRLSLQAEGLESQLEGADGATMTMAADDKEDHPTDSALLW